MDNQNQFVFAGDGDGIGKHHAQAILSDDIQKIHQVSAQITHGNEVVKDFALANGGMWISGGGDEFLFIAPVEFANSLEELRELYLETVGATLSIGYGKTPSEAGKALLAAKERGKNQVAQYDDSVEQEVQHLQNDRGSPEDEEKKKIRQVMESDQKVVPSEPPKEDNNRGYDSGYKNSDPEQNVESYQAQDMTAPIIRKPNLTDKPRVEEAVSGDVPESSRLMNEKLPDPKDKEAQDKKPAPKDYHGQAEGVASAVLGEVPEKAPESMAQPQDGKPSDIKYNNDGNDNTEQLPPQADIPGENATSDEAMETEEESMGESRHCPSCTCGAHDEDLDSLLDQHLENAKDFEDSIDDGQPKNTTDLLDAHLDNQQEMLQDMDEQGVSRPAGYDEKQGDMGLSEEEANQNEPNLDEVLREGLDSHADGIQKEKVIQLVGQALDGFKAQKAILDKAKEQAPELYDSCINMLRAMIELCSLAGLNAGEAEQEVNEIEGQDEAPEEQPGSEEIPSEDKESCPNCGHEKDKVPHKEEGIKPPQP